VDDAGSLVQGKVDLLYESGDGRLVIVDYKTDSVADPQLIRERYAVQGGAYALAVNAALAGTGGAAAASRVSEVVFVLAAAAPPVVRLPVDDALTAATRARIAEVVAH
jgi:ATP-dependent exoDNAse (exonuclease V) beta subunit